MFSKKKLLASTDFDVVEAQRKSFIKILDSAWEKANEGRHAEAQERVAEADALWKKVKKVHGVEL